MVLVSHRAEEKHDTAGDLELVEISREGLAAGRVVRCVEEERGMPAVPFEATGPLGAFEARANVGIGHIETAFAELGQRGKCTSRVVALILPAKPESQAGPALLAYTHGK